MTFHTHKETSPFLQELSLPALQSLSPVPWDQYPKVDALGMHVLLVGAREEQIALLDPIFEITFNGTHELRLGVVECQHRFQYLASVEPIESPSRLLREGRIVEPCALLPNPSDTTKTYGDASLTIQVSVPESDPALREIPARLLAAVDQNKFETCDITIVPRFHNFSHISQHSFTFRPRPITLVFPVWRHGSDGVEG